MWKRFLANNFSPQNNSNWAANNTGTLLFMIKVNGIQLASQLYRQIFTFHTCILVQSHWNISHFYLYIYVHTISTLERDNNLSNDLRINKYRNEFKINILSHLGEKERETIEYHLYISFFIVKLKICLNQIT